MRKKNLKILAALAVTAGSFTALTGTASASTVFISPGDSLQAALVAAGIGGTVVLNCGTYSTQQVVDGWTGYDATHNYSFVRSRKISEGATAPDCAFITGRLRIKNTHGVKFDSLTFKPSGNLQGVYIESGTTLRFTASKFDTINQTAGGSASKGLQTDSAGAINDVIVSGDVFVNTAVDSIYIGGGSNLDVHDNTFYRPIAYSDGVHRDFVQVDKGSDLAIYDNMMTGPGLGTVGSYPNQGIILASTVSGNIHDFTVYGNRVEHLDGSAYLVSGSGVMNGSVNNNTWCHVRGSIVGSPGSGVTLLGNSGTNPVTDDTGC